MHRALLIFLTGFVPLAHAADGETYFCTPISSHAIHPVEGARKRSPDHERFIFSRETDGTLEFKPGGMNNLYATKIVQVSDENEEIFWANSTDKTLAYADGLLSASYIVNAPLDRKPNGRTPVVWVDYAKCEVFRIAE